MTTSDEGNGQPTSSPRPSMSDVAGISATVIVVIALAFATWTIRGVIVMVVIGFLLASGLDPVVRSLQRRVHRRGVAVLIVVLTLTVGGTLFAVLAVRPAISQFAEFLADLPELLDRLAQRFGDPAATGQVASPEFEQQVRGAVDDIVAFAADSLGVVIGLLSTVAGAVFTGFTVVAITVYVMLALPRIKTFAARAAGDPERVAVVAEVFRRVGGYVTGQLGVCATAGVASAIFFLVIGLPYPALLAMVVAILDAVPQVGATIAAAIATVVALTVSVGTAVAVIVFFIAYQQFENWVVAPRVFASAVALSPISVFLAVLVGGTLAGFIGAILALPVAATLTVVFRYVFRRTLADMESRDVPDDIR